MPFYSVTVNVIYNLTEFIIVKYMLLRHRVAVSHNIINLYAFYKSLNEMLLFFVNIYGGHLTTSYFGTWRSIHVVLVLFSNNFAP